MLRYHQLCGRRQGAAHPRSQVLHQFREQGQCQDDQRFRWHSYSGFITNQLSEIARFLDSSKENIDTRNKDITTKVEDLLKVMTSLKNLDERRDDIYLALDRIEETLKTFEKRHDKKKDGEMKKVNKLMEENKTITFVAAKIEKEINGPKTIEAGKNQDQDQEVRGVPQVDANGPQEEGILLLRHRS